MSTIQFTSKEAFVRALQERRAFWKAYDERRTAEHKVAEEQWLRAAQEKLRSRLSWTYEDFKKRNRYGSSVSLGDFPVCPVLKEHQLDNVLSVLGYTQAKTFRVGREGTWAHAHELLTHDPDAQTTVC